MARAWRSTRCTWTDEADAGRRSVIGATPLGAPIVDALMVKVDLVTAKLSELSARIARVRKHSPATVEALKADADALDLVAFNVMLCVQSAADIAAHLVADEGWRAASTVAESFDRLRAQGVLEQRTADLMGKATGLRDVVAHGYSTVDVAMVFAAASHGVGDLDAFAAEVAAWVQARVAPPADS